MKLQEYIASGVLEAYLLGQLSPEESTRVETMRVKHAEIQQEMVRIEESLELMAQKTAVTPRESVRENIISKIKAPGHGIDEVIPMKKPKNRGLKYLAAASIALALVSSAVSIKLWNQLKETEQRLNNLLAENQQLAEDFELTNYKLEQTNTDLAIIVSEEYQKVVMKSTGSDGALASVYWNQENTKVYLSSGSLPLPPTDKQYQLWALINGKPVDAGVFDLPEEGNPLQEMKSIAAADAFAITLEPRGGSVSPTLEELKVMGNV